MALVAVQRAEQAGRMMVQVDEIEAYSSLVEGFNIYSPSRRQQGRGTGLQILMRSAPGHKMIRLLASLGRLAKLGRPSSASIRSLAHTYAVPMATAPAAGGGLQMPSSLVRDRKALLAVSAVICCGADRGPFVHLGILIRAAQYGSKRLLEAGKGEEGRVEEGKGRNETEEEGKGEKKEKEVEAERQRAFRRAVEEERSAKGLLEVKQERLARLATPPLCSSNHPYPSFEVLCRVSGSRPNSGLRQLIGSMLEPRNPTPYQLPDLLSCSWDELECLAFVADINNWTDGASRPQSSPGQAAKGGSSGRGSDDLDPGAEVLAEAARIIQCGWRRAAALREVSRRKERVAATQKMQRVVRGHLGRKAAKRQRNTLLAAEAVQRAWRCHVARRETAVRRKLKRAREAEEEEKAEQAERAAKEAGMGVDDAEEADGKGEVQGEMPLLLIPHFYI
eukprot:Sspe_Gene.5100::Locus_1678_Transcript_1_1_Confidence_1.000_Length_1398::g.5100::m.5100